LQASRLHRQRLVTTLGSPIRGHTESNEDSAAESQEQTPSEVSSTNPARSKTSRKQGRQAVETEQDLAIIDYLKQRGTHPSPGQGIMDKLQSIESQQDEKLRLLESRQDEKLQLVSQKLESLDVKLDALLTRLLR